MLLMPANKTITCTNTGFFIIWLHSIFSESYVHFMSCHVWQKPCCIQTIYSRLSLTQLCITQYYHLSRPGGPVSVFSPIYYCNSTTFISTTAKSIKLITCCKKLVPLINFNVFTTPNSIPFLKKLPFYLNVSPINAPISTLIIPIKTTNFLITWSTCVTHADCQLVISVLYMYNYIIWPLNSIDLLCTTSKRVHELCHIWAISVRWLLVLNKAKV